MNDRINERVALCVWEIMHKKHDPILTNLFYAVIRAHDLAAELGVNLFLIVRNLG